MRKEIYVLHSYALLAYLQTEPGFAGSPAKELEASAVTGDLEFRKVGALVSLVEW